MITSPEWASLPSVVDAADQGDYGTILRKARTAAGLTLEQVGQRAGYSPSALSRLETGHRRTCDAKELRHLAEVYGVPLHLMGLSGSPQHENATSLSVESDNGGDPMRRRALLAGGVLAVTGATFPPRDPVAAAEAMTETIEDVLTGRLSAAPIAEHQLEAQIAAAVADFQACRYAQLTRRLPRLLAQATTGHDQAPTDQAALAAGRLARAYNVATDLLTKLHDDAMAWSTSDRALQAALASGDPLIEAETTRLKAIVHRRTHHRAGAQRLVLQAAEQLQSAAQLREPGHSALYSQLMATAAYTAALNDDRDNAQTLYREAETAHRRESAGTDHFSRLDLSVYRIGIVRALGDFGAAVEYARHIDPTTITAPARRARYWEDTALALHGRGRPEATYRALLAAERDTPQEVRYRPWAQHLTKALLSVENRHTLPDIHVFAQRIGATV